MHSETDPPAMIERLVKTIERVHRQAPIGWMGPGTDGNLDTPDHLKVAGIKYICDWVWDDEPAEISTKHGPLYHATLLARTNEFP